MEHESLFSLSNPEFWVLVALVVFFGLLVFLKVLPGALFGALDNYSAKIKAELILVQKAIDQTKYEIAALHLSGEESPDINRMSDELGAIVSGRSAQYGFHRAPCRYHRIFVRRNPRRYTHLD